MIVKNGALKRTLAVVLALAILLPFMTDGLQWTASAAPEYTYTEQTVYDIRDLTGKQSNTFYGAQAGSLGIAGVGDNWSDTVIGNVKAEDKENVILKAKVTVDAMRTDGPDSIRLSIGMLSSQNAVDFKGYALRILVDPADGKTYFGFYRNGQNLAYWEEESAIGTYDFEFGIQSIMEGETVVGKRITLKKDENVLKTYDDMTGFLTGDTLGTKVAIFHYTKKVEMESTKEVIPQTVADGVVYDIRDLTGKQSNTFYGAQAGSLGIAGVGDNWSDTVIGNVKAEDKENVILKAKVTVDAMRTDGPDSIRLSIGMLSSQNAVDFKGYALRILVDPADGKTYFGFYRNGENLAYWEAESAIGTYELEFGIQSIMEGENVVGKRITLKKDENVLKTYDDMTGFLTGDTLGTKVAIFHYTKKVEMESTKEVIPQTVVDAEAYDIEDLTGKKSNQIDSWKALTLGHFAPEHKESASVKAVFTTFGVQGGNFDTVRLSLGALEHVDLTDPKGYALVTKEYDGVQYLDFRRNGHTLNSFPLSASTVPSSIEMTEVMMEFGYRSIMEGETLIGKQLFVNVDGVETFTYDDFGDTAGTFLTGDALGTRVGVFHYQGLKMDTTKAPVEYTPAEAKVYDLYDLQGVEHLTVIGRTSNPDNWGTTLGNILEAHKRNMAFKSTVTMDEAQTVMLGIGLTELSSAVLLSSGYTLEIVTKAGENEADVLKIHRAGTQIYVQDMEVDLNGEYELEFGVVDLFEVGAPDTPAGRRIYVKKDGQELLHYDDAVDALPDSQLGVKVDVYASGIDLPLASVRNYQAGSATVYDIYDLSFREKLEVNSKDANGEKIWGVLIGNADESGKGNVALKTKVTLQKNTQQNLIIGLGLKGHWPVSGGFGYQIELSADPNNANDTVYIYKNTTTDGSNMVTCYGGEQKFDFNGSFLLEYGVVNLYDEGGAVVARRIYIKADGTELMHFDDTTEYVSAGAMGTVIAAYVSDGTAILGTCAGSIPKTDVKVYDLYDLLGRATMNLNRTDAGGGVIWTNVLGNVPDTNNMNYALRVNVDTSKVDRSALQELILALCKQSDLFDQAGYRISLYFAPNGGTSFVMRDSADEVLGSYDGFLPEKYELEMGITDFFNSQRKLVGKKIYVKIDGKEVLSCLDKNLGRLRGNLLCAYTTNPVTLSTLYGYATLPVTYIVNGQEQQSSPYILANTDVVPGNKSLINVTLAGRDAQTSVVLQKVLLNGEPIIPISTKQGVYQYELEAPSKDDQLTVEIEVHHLTVDEAEVYDLYELTGKDKIVIPAYSVDQIGTLFADGQEGVLNRAIRFAYYIPKTGGGLRLGYGSDTSDIWSRTGTHIELWVGFATISHGFHVSALSTGAADVFKPDSWSIAEVGIVKCYEDGVYKYDRWYVKAGTSVENMQLITWYDSTQRHGSTLNIVTRTPDTGDDFIVASTLAVRSVTDISDEAAKENAKAVYKPLFLEGESITLAVFPNESKDLEKLLLNGEEVTPELTADGSYVVTVENAMQDISFSYTLKEDSRTYGITAEDAEHVKIVTDKESVLAGGTATVQIQVDGGYRLTSLLVNGVEFLPMASYDKTTLSYTLVLSGIREDKRIEVQAQKFTEDAPIAEGGAQKADSGFDPVVIAVIAGAMVLLGGAVILLRKKTGKREQKNEKTEQR